MFDITLCAGNLDALTADDSAALRKFSADTFSVNGVSIDEELSRDWARIWVLRTEGQVIGFLGAWHVADELHILTIAVRETERRKGFASAILADAIGYAKTHHIRLILLEVRRSNRAAIELYRRFSFSASGTRAGYYGDTGEDAIEMVLAMDPTTGEELPSADEVRV